MKRSFAVSFVVYFDHENHTCVSDQILFTSFCLDFCDGFLQNSSQETEFTLSGKGWGREKIKQRKT
jgi:hypothetical protein